MRLSEGITGCDVWIQFFRGLGVWVRVNILRWEFGDSNITWAIGNEVVALAACQHSGCCLSKDPGLLVTLQKAAPALAKAAPASDGLAAWFSSMSWKHRLQSTTSDVVGKALVLTCGVAVSVRLKV